MIRTRHLSRATYVTLAAAATVLVGAPAAATTVPSDDATATSAAASATTGSAEFTITDAGDPATAIVLEYPAPTTVEVGTSLRSVETQTFAGTIEAAGLPTSDSTFTVTSEAVETITIEESSGTGAVATRVVTSYDETLEGRYAADFADDDSDDGDRLDVPVRAVYDADNQITEASAVDPAALTEDQQDAIDELVDDPDDGQFTLPEEPLGVGATWSGQFNFVDTDDPVIADFTLVAIDDTTFTVEFDLSSAAAQIFDIDADEGALGPDPSITGTVVASLPGEAVRLDVTMDMDVQFTVGDGGQQATFDIQANFDRTLEPA